MKTINAVCRVIESLEAKRDDGTITFEEYATLSRLIEFVESITSEIN